MIFGGVLNGINRAGTNAASQGLGATGSIPANFIKGMYFSNLVMTNLTKINLRM